MTDPVSTAVAAPRLALGAGAAAYEAAVERARTEEWASRLFARDVSLWTADPRVAETISERLGWLDAPEHFTEQIPGLEGFGDAVVDEGYTTAVVAGMGGSSLAPDILRRTFGSTEGYLELRILDSTDPAYVARGPRRPRSAADARHHRLEVGHDDRAATRSSPTPGRGPRRPSRRSRTIATSIPGAYFAVDHGPRQERRDQELQRLPRDLPQPARHRRPLFRADLRRAGPGVAHRRRPGPLAGGRRGDAGRLPRAGPGAQPGPVARARHRHAGQGRPRQADVPDRRRDRELRGVGGAAARREHGQARRRHRPGRPRAARRGRGVRRRPGVRPDRAGRGATRAGATRSRTPSRRPATRSSGSSCRDPIDLGAEAIRWEVATAIAGIVLGIDPFDQPNVEEAKQLTRDVLDRSTGEHGPPTQPEPIASGDGLAPVRRRGAPADRERRRRRRPSSGRHLARRRSDAYLCLQGVHRPDRRAATRRSPGSARCSATGPAARRRPATARASSTRPASCTRAAPPIGWFIQLTADHPADRPIPGWPYTFGQLIDAQAAGDFAAIESHDLPIVRVHLGADPDAGLAALERRWRPPSNQARRPDQPMRIGFIGLGRMGANMVRRLVRDGHEIVVYNRTPEKTREIAGEGATASFSIAELVAQAGEAACGLDHGPGRRRHRGPDRTSCSSTSSRATRSSTAATRTSTTTCAATPSSRRRASATSTPGRRAGSGASRSATA